MHVYVLKDNRCIGVDVVDVYYDFVNFDNNFHNRRLFFLCSNFQHKETKTKAKFVDDKISCYKVPLCYSIKMDSFRSKILTVVFLLKLLLIRDTLIVERYFIADNYSQILRLK